MLASVKLIFKKNCKLTLFNVNVLSTDGWTVLMVSTTAVVSEDKIARCVELLLSRNADPNMVDR